MTHTVPPRVSFWSDWLPPLLAGVAVTVLYAAACWNNAFVYDDHEVIENQYPVHRLADVRQIFAEPHYFNFPYYRPITRTTFAIQKAIHGNEPRPFHLFNAVLAGVVLVLAYAVLRTPAFGIGRAAALLGATFFAVHPVTSECVYPAASGRETMLPVAVILLSLWCFLRRGWGWYFAAIAAWTVSLFAKELAVVVPVVFFAADWLGVAHWPRTVRSVVVRYVPMLIIGSAYWIIRGHVLSHVPLKLEWFDHRLRPLQALVYAIQSAIAPYSDLTYEPPLSVWWSPIRTTCAAITLALLALVAWKYARTQIKAMAFWLAWFIVIQMPTAGFVHQDAPFSERYVFPALLSVAAIGGIALTAVWRRVALFGVAGCAVIIALLAWASFYRAGYFTDDAAFCVQWSITNPDSENAHNGLGLCAQQRNEIDEAFRQYGISLSINPNSVTALNNLGNLYSQRAPQLAAAGQRDQADNDVHQAEACYARLLAINPRDQKALCNRGDLRAMTGRFKGAAADFEAAISIQPGYAVAHYHLALALDLLGDAPRSVHEFEEALRLQPDWPEVLDAFAQRSLADPDGRFHDRDRAIALAEKAVRLTNGSVPQYVRTLNAARGPAA